MRKAFSLFSLAVLVFVLLGVPAFAAGQGGYFPPPPPGQGFPPQPGQGFITPPEPGMNPDVPPSMGMPSVQSLISRMAGLTQGLANAMSTSRFPLSGPEMADIMGEISSEMNDLANIVRKGNMIVPPGDLQNLQIRIDNTQRRVEMLR
ncbi:MAG: hypothetical protein M0Z59_06375 [Nitrospiraceae bacterium]|nr:hypothetical protein [Nitrospiraceae bacterium]